MPINVMYARVWGQPRVAKHTKLPPNEKTGLPTELNYEKDKCNLTVISGC